ncbi:uncharacterized protein LOC126188074 [Schistocerca cancellata]|uniref:uncharacterized protein LOC126188074 n=1 Tax=Schistocerca cancellata TaxID=274614 RepID=UPI0021188D2F|nr:uncharacterized protein LOC126188074 [Schistocerca cancellata]
MGAAWCRERAAHAHDSKSPLDRVIVSCVDKVYPQPKSPTAAVIPLDGEHCQRTYNITSVPLPAVHTPRRLNGGGAVTASGWQSADLEVPAQRQQDTTSEDCESIGPTPVPPPRKKRRARSSAATAGAAARVAAAQAEAAAAAAAGVAGPPKAQRLQQRSVSTIVPPTIRTDDGDIRVQKLSTVSLPDYQQLDQAKLKAVDRNHLSPGTGSGVASSLSSISEATVERLETYLRRCRSFGSVNAEELVEQLAARSRSHSPSHSPASSSDEDSDDSWEMGGVDNPVRPGEGPPLSPTHRLSGKRRRLGVALPRGSLPSEEQPWFHSQREPREASDSPSAFFADNDRRPEESDTESGLREVRKELQSIVYDFNVYGSKESKSRTDLEILPTKPITQERKKKISIKSITPPPSPELTDHEEEPIKNGEVNTRTDVVSKILNGYDKVIASATALRNPEVEAEAVLRQLGVPASLSEGSPATAGSSRRSSMTPSLSELEAAISDLLEQTQAADGDDDDNGSADNRINNMLEDSDKNKRPDGRVAQTIVPGAAGLPGKTAGADNENLKTDSSAPADQGSHAADAASSNEATGPTKKGSPDNVANGISRLSQHHINSNSSGIPIDVSASKENPSISILTDTS